jgi:hypothetical protein
MDAAWRFGRTVDMHRPISRRIEPLRAEFSPAPEGPTPDPFRTRGGALLKARGKPERVPPQPVEPVYLAKPNVALDSEEGGNDMGLFLGRSFRVCFSSTGQLFMPCKNFPGAGGDASGAYVGAHKVAALALCGRSFQPGRYSELLQKHAALAEAADAHGARVEDLMAHVDKYVSGEGPGELAALLRLVAALQAPDARGALAGVSAWLQAEAERVLPHPLPGPSPLDDIFVLLSARRVDEACDVAVDAGQLDLALLLAQAGEHTSLARDMRAQVDWLDKSKRAELVESGVDAEAAKLLHIYRLLAGDVDGLLEGLRADHERDPARVPGGRLLDWKRTLSLYLWYAFPAAELMELPPPGMETASRRDLFTSDARLHLSLQGAVQYYLHQVWQREGHFASHPWPAIFERPGPEPSPPPRGALDAGSDRLRVRHPHVVRQLWRWEPAGAAARGCPQLPSTVRERLRGAGAGAGLAPGAGTLREAEAQRGGAGRELWVAWPSDAALHLLLLFLPQRACGVEASLARALAPEACSPAALDLEAPWHLHEVLRRAAPPLPPSY